MRLLPVVLGLACTTPSGGTYVGRSADSDVFVAAVVHPDDDTVMAYACDGEPDGVTVATWFRGAFAEERADLASVDGYALFLDRDGRLSGELWLSSDGPEAVTLEPSLGDDGLYREEVDGDVTGWIVIDGEVRGATKSGSTTTTTTSDPTGKVTTPPPAPTTDFSSEPTALRGILSAHKNARLAATPTPSPALPVLTWSPALAELAHEWAHRCTLGFNPNRGVAGENFARVAPGTSTTPAQWVGLWTAQAADYDYASNTCAVGKVCGNYLQVVWRQTTMLGCGYADCPNLGPGRLVVCDYQSPGIVIGGPRPY